MIAAREVTPQAMINRHLISPWSLTVEDSPSSRDPSRGAVTSTSTARGEDVASRPQPLVVSRGGMNGGSMQVCTQLRVRVSCR